MPLKSTIHEFPLAKWGLEFKGLVNPPSSICHVFILTETYYFTKWFEAIPLKHSKDE